MRRIIDLTMDLYEGMPSHPLHPHAPVVLSGTMSHSTTRPWFPDPTPFGRVSFANEQVVLSGHTGTHIDAPFHGNPDGHTIERVPLDVVYGPAIWLDVSPVCTPRALITAAHLEEALQNAGGALEPIVLLYTGWSRWASDDPKRYFHESPGIAEDGARWLCARNVRTLGVDAPTIDRRGDRVCAAHMLFLRPPDGKSYVYVIENLVRVAEIPSHRFLFIGLPLPLRGVSGSPIRAVAVVE